MAILLIEQARAYLDALEADRMAALALTEQKAEEAKLIQARQEGFRAALDILCGETSAGDAVSGKDREPSAGRLGDGDGWSSASRLAADRRASATVNSIGAW